MNLIRLVCNSFKSWGAIALGACELALHERRSALEQEHGQLAWVVQVETLIGLAGDFKAEAFAHNTVERLSILSIHLFFHDFASLLKVEKKQGQSSNFSNRLQFLDALKRTIKLQHLLWCRHLWLPMPFRCRLWCVAWLHSQRVGPCQYPTIRNTRRRY